MKLLFAAVSMSIALAGAALAQDGAKPQPAAAEAQAQSPYVVIREDARIPFAGRTINGFRVGEDRNSIIFTVAGHRFYRGELDSYCARNLRFDYRIGLDRRFGGGAVERGSIVIIEGQRCMLLSLDEIADPRAPREAQPTEGDRS